MEVHQLRYFVAVAETLSFSRAARRCAIAQPSLSQQIRKLERHLGYRLFDRLARGAALTDAGRALLPRARTILAEINAVDAGLRADLDAGRGALVVGAIPTMAPFVLPPLLKRFMRRFPDAQLTIRENFTERLLEAVLDNEIDVAIMSTPVDNDVIQLEVVGRERLLLAAATDYTFPGRPQHIAIDDLRGQPAVVVHEMHCLGQQIDSFCSARGLIRRIVCRTTQLPTVLHLVELGLGISLIPEMCARSDASRARRYYPLGDDGPEREIAVASRVDRTRSRLAREFVAMLREDFAAGRHRFPPP